MLTYDNYLKWFGERIPKKIPLITHLNGNKLESSFKSFLLVIFITLVPLQCLIKILPFNQVGWIIIGSRQLVYCIATNQDHSLLRKLLGYMRAKVLLQLSHCVKSLLLCPFGYKRHEYKWNRIHRIKVVSKRVNLIQHDGYLPLIDLPLQFSKGLQY